MAQPNFVPKPGQVDYTHIRYAPVVNIILTYDNKILCVKRSSDMRLYPNQWDWVCGFLDDKQSIDDKVREELYEELTIGDEQIVSIKQGRPWINDDPHYQKTWLTIPILATVTSTKITLNWEASEAQWFSIDQIKKLSMVPGATYTAAEFFPDLQ